MLNSEDILNRPDQKTPLRRFHWSRTNNLEKYNLVATLYRSRNQSMVVCRRDLVLNAKATGMHDRRCHKAHHQEGITP